MIRSLILTLSLLAALSGAQIIEQPLGHNALWDREHCYQIISSARTKIDRGHEVWSVIFLLLKFCESVRSLSFREEKYETM